MIIGNGCSDDTATLEIAAETPVGVSETAGAGKGIKLFPNPAVSEVTIHSAGHIEHIELFDIRGAQVTVGTSMDKNRASLDISGIANGVYIVQVMAQGQVSRHSLVVRR